MRSSFFHDAASLVFQFKRLACWPHYIILLVIQPLPDFPVRRIPCQDVFRLGKNITGEFSVGHGGTKPVFVMRNSTSEKWPHSQCRAARQATFNVFGRCTHAFAILQRLRMLRGFPAFEWWVEPPDEVFLRLYIFNITNKDAFLAGTEKLKVKEVGPWIFR